MRWFREVFMNFRRSGFISLISIGTIVLAVSALSGYYIINESLYYVINKVQQKVEVVVFMHEGVQKEKIDNIISEASTLPGVADINFTSKETAYTDFLKDPDIAGIMKTFDGNPLPDSINVKLKEYSKENINKIVRFFDSKEGVEDIQYGGSEIENILNIIKVVKMISGVAGIIFLISALLVVSNIIRLTIYARRQDIYILRMIGASGTFIRMPYIIEGVVHGLIGGITGWALLYSVISILLSKIRLEFGIDLTEFYLFAPMFLNVKLLLASTATGIMLGFSGALFAQGKLFRG
jgi:cell division transport system permease protein